MEDSPLIAGLDVGTTNTKASVFEPSGRVVSSARGRTPMDEPRPGWHEHDAAELWSVAGETLRAALGRLRSPARVVGVAVASMAESGVPLDAAGRPVGPVIAWFDRRTRPQAERLRRRLGAERLREVTGLRPQPIYGLYKLMWLAEHRPEAYARTRAWANVADYLAFRLSGELATDASLASRTGALELASLRWSEPVLEAAGVPASLLPEPTWAGTALGGVTEDAAAATDLAPGTTVAAGGHDHVCGALAAGVVDEGRVLDSIGTAESILTPVPRARSAPPGCGYGAHVVRDRWYVAGGVHAAGASVQWVLDLVGGDPDRLLAQAEDAPPGAGGARFLPHLRSRDGEVVPRGALVGLTPGTGRPEVVRAVLEGLAFAFREILETVGAQSAEVRAIGGGTRNRLLMQLKATTLGRALVRVELAEATSLGAALLSGVGAGLFPDAATAAASVELATETVEPDHERVADYDARFRRLADHDLTDLRALSRILEG